MFVVGDDKNDIVAGKNANIRTVAVTYGYGKVKKIGAMIILSTNLRS
jgi:phosphoglycolate phosphatase